MALTLAQKQTLATALRAETNPEVVAALLIRNDVFLAAWCNQNSTQDAWSESMDGPALFEATDVTVFDGLTAGKRDAWRLMLTFAPINFEKNKNRKAVQDVWGNVDSVAVLQACTRKATNGEKYLGGTNVTTNTVSAWKLNYTGSIAMDEVSNALNTF